MDDGHDWEFVKRVTHPALILAPASFLDDICANLWAHGVQVAVARRQTAPIFDWLMRLVQLQGISDTIAFAYADKHGIVRWADIGLRLRRQARDRALGRHRSRARGGAVLPEAEELLAFRGLPIRQGGPHLRRAGAPAPMPLAVSPVLSGLAPLPLADGTWSGIGP